MVVSAATKKYRTSPKGRATLRAYRKTAKYKAYHNKLECARQKRMHANDKIKSVIKNYRRKYGLSLEQFILMFCDQDVSCGICGRRDPGPGVKEWSVDHNHSKQKGDVGFVRGILCRKCNVGGGSFNDDPALLIAAAAWFSK